MTTTADKESEQAMDLAAAYQRIAWLDEERRRDHGEIARLAQDMASALTVLKEQVVKMRETGDRVKAIETGMERIARLEDAITSARSEMGPLRDADIKMQDDLLHQAKERQVQTDQTARLATDFNSRLDTVSKSVDGLLSHIQELDAQQKEQLMRIGETSARLDALVKSTDVLTGRLQLLESREHERVTRESLVPAQMDNLAKGAEALAGRIHLLETRDKDRAAREGALQAQLSRLVQGDETLAGRLQLLETRDKDRANRESTLPAQLANLVRGDEALAGRLQLIETREKDRTNRESTLPAQLANLARGDEALAERLHLIETREKDRLDRETRLFTQMSQLDVNQGQAIEEVKRSVARAESIVTDMQQLRREIMLARDDEAKQRTNDSGVVSELHESVLANQRRIEEVADATPAIQVRLADLEERAPQADDLNKRLLMAEEKLAVTEATYKALQEVEDRHWNTDIPMLLHEVEESSNTTQNSAATVAELVAASQALREAVRELQVSLVAEHAFSEDLAAALRGLIEEDLQTRLATTQKQLQTLRRLANAPVETTTTNEP